MSELPEGDALDRMLSAVADGMDRRLSRRRRRRRMAVSGMVLATAASAVGLALASWRGGEIQPSAPVASLDVASSRSFVVIPTSRPDITVVWLMNRSEP